MPHPSAIKVFSPTFTGITLAVSPPTTFLVVGGLLPVANANCTGLQPAQFANSYVDATNEKYILLHKSQAEDWNNFMFIIALSGNGNKSTDSLFIVNGSTNCDSKEALCNVYFLYGDSSIICSVKYIKNRDKSVSVYLVSKEETFGGFGVFKIPLHTYGENVGLSIVDSLDVASLKDATIE